MPKEEEEKTLTLTPSGGPEYREREQERSRSASAVPRRQAPARPHAGERLARPARRPRRFVPQVGRLLGGRQADGRRNRRPHLPRRRRESPRSESTKHLHALARLGYVELIDPSDFLTEEQLAADFAALGVRAWHGRDDPQLPQIRRPRPRRRQTPSSAPCSRVLGPAGTLLAPSFNHFEAKVFNPLTTPTTNGAIPDALWRRADAVRSTHPSHAVAAIGPRAAEYVRGHLANGIWADGQPHRPADPRRRLPPLPRRRPRPQHRLPRRRDFAGRALPRPIRQCRPHRRSRRASASRPRPRLACRRVPGAAGADRAGIGCQWLAAPRPGGAGTGDAGEGAARLVDPPRAARRPLPHLPGQAGAEELAGQGGVGAGT